MLSIICCFGGGAIDPATAQDATTEPLINLTADNQSLGDVLERIARDTGYRFNLDRKWKDHRVSATVNGLPLEQGLKRLLRSLNHTIIWESDKRVTIMVFGKADPIRPGSAISHSAPPQVLQASDEPEPAEGGVEALDAEVPAEEDDAPEPDPVEPDQEDADSE